MTEFPNKGWTRSSIKGLLLKLRKYRQVALAAAACRQRSAHTEENVKNVVESLELSQEV